MDTAPEFYWIRYTEDRNWILVSCCYGHPITSFDTKPGSGFAGSTNEHKMSSDGFTCHDCEALGRRKKERKL
jgi:hypothetical protein